MTTHQSKTTATFEAEVLEELRMVDPQAGASARASDPDAQRLFSRIAVPGQRRARSGRRLAVIAMAGGTVATAAIVIAVVALMQDGSGNGATTGPDGELVPGGGFAMCAEQYSPETLVGRQFAFAGTVTGIEGTEVTFAVDRWFRGGDSHDITLEAGGLLGLTSLDDTTVLQVGERYLVSGDEHFAWSCGFTQGYSDELAAEWEAALR